MQNSFFYASRYMAKWLFLAVLVGIGGGLAAVVLNSAIDFVTDLSAAIPVWLSPAVGAALIVIIYAYWDRQAAGSGTNHYLYAVNIDNGDMRFRTLFSKIAATAATLGFRGSGGVEGPMVVIGGSLAKGLSRIPFIGKLLDDDDFRLLAIGGAAGAVGAVFRSPLGGGIFVVEVLYRTSLHYHDLFPAVLSSTMGFVAYCRFASGTPLFMIPDYLPDAVHVPWYIVSGLISGAIAFLFMIIFGMIKRQMQRIAFPFPRPIIGGVLTGLVLLWVPAVGGTGSEVIQQLITESQSWVLLLALLVGKILAASFTVGSGGSGGLVIPALFIGAVSGNWLASFTAGGDPNLTASLVVSGMAASLASIANVPIVAAVMLIEMVGMNLGIPVVLGSIIGYAVGRSRTVYDTTSQTEVEFVEAQRFRKRDRDTEEH